MKVKLPNPNIRTGLRTGMRIGMPEQNPTPYIPGIPPNALLNEDGTPILNEDGSYILLE